MKAKLHIPTEQYGFIETEVEVTDTHEALRLYRDVLAEKEGGEGLGIREWAQTRDNYLNNGGEIDLEVWERMSKLQRWFINEIKKVIRKNNHE